MWIMDSGCSRHMTGDVSKFSTINYIKKGTVSFGNSGKLKIIGKGTIEVSPKIIIHKVLLVKNMGFNLLSVSQLCDAGYNVEFHPNKCIVKHKNLENVMLEGFRKANLYYVDLSYASNPSIKCLMSKEEEGWLWHRRLGHINMKNIAKVAKMELVKGLPKIKYIKDKLCDACQEGKQSRSSHKGKTLTSTS